jgi:hypothetical protein
MPRVTSSVFSLVLTPTLHDRPRFNDATVLNISPIPIRNVPMTSKTIEFEIGKAYFSKLGIVCCNMKIILDIPAESMAMFNTKSLDLMLFPIFLDKRIALKKKKT